MVIEYAPTRLLLVGSQGQCRIFALDVRCDEGVGRWVGYHLEFRIYLENVGML